MGYDTKTYYSYEKKLNAIRCALDYLWVANYEHNGDKEKMLESCKANLRRLHEERHFSAMIKAIKILKKELKIKTVIKHDI